MPRLRDDITEARSRADSARKALAKKLRKDQDWTRDDKIMSIDGLDSLVEMADEVLPFIPDGVVRGQAVGLGPIHGGGDGTTVVSGGNPPPIIPNPSSPHGMYAPIWKLGGGTVKPGKPVHLGHIASPTWPGKPAGFDAGRPNLLLDGDRHVWNHNDVDYTGDTAGSTQRDSLLVVRLHVPEGHFGDLVVYARNDGGDNQIVARGTDPGFAKTIEVRGAEIRDQVAVPIALSGPPRGGTKDWVQVSVDMVPYEGSKSIELTPDSDSFAQMQFALPHTMGSHYRDVQIHTVEGSLTLTSINEVLEDDGFLFFVGDHGYAVQAINIDDLIGFWFGRLSGAQHSYDVLPHNETAGLGFRADDLLVANGRFSVVRGATVEGWLDATKIRSISISD